MGGWVSFQMISSEAEERLILVQRGYYYNPVPAYFRTSHLLILIQNRISISQLWTIVSWLWTIVSQLWTIVSRLWTIVSRLWSIVSLVVDYYKLVVDYCNPVVDYCNATGLY